MRGATPEAGQVRDGRAVTGNPNQTRFTEVFVPHLTDAYRLARWLSRSRADADDIVQEASLRALGAVDRFDGINPRAWVLSIVRNTALTWMARNRSPNVVAEGDLESGDRAAVDAKAGGETPESAAIANDEQKAIRARVAALPPDFREVLVLREVHDLGYREIAAIVEVPVGTVMSRLARARRMLIDQAEEGRR